MSADIRSFGRTRDGTEVKAVTLRAGDLTATVLSRGAIVQDVRLTGADWPLTLGSDDLAAYEAGMEYFGGIVGPVANRITGSQAMIDGRLFRFEANDDGRATLHGGSTGVHAQVWQIVEAAADRLLLRLDLADGLGGFPGNRRVTAEFVAQAPATLTLRIVSQTDAPTLSSYTNHSYWNLDAAPTTAGHRLRVAADRYTRLTPDLLPTGEVLDVTGTVYDLRKGRELQDIPTYDVNLCRSEGQHALTEVAELAGRKGVRLRLATTEPGLQIYDAARVDSRPFVGHRGIPDTSFCGLAMEAQYWPDAPNQPAFPSILLQPGARREQVTRFTFDRV